MKARYSGLALVLLGVVPVVAFGHSGGLNAQGCHTNRQTGDYHCHRAQAPAPAPRARTAPAENRGVYYRNCDAARAAGAAPVYFGEPGYGAHLDRDNDGIGCE